MSNILKLQALRAKNILVLLPAVAMLLAGAAVFVPPKTAYADDGLQNYCQNKVKSDKAAKGCTVNNMNRIRDAVDNGCSGKKDPKSCVQDSARNVIDQIASKNPKSEADFNNQLASALSDIKNKTHGGGDNCDASECSPTPTGQGKNCDDNHCDLIALYVNPGIRLLSVLVGLVVAGSLVYAGIQYTTSSGDPQKTGAAKTRITNTLLAFFAYAFMLAFLNFLIPGGIF
jgi:hypothetical protein